MYLQIFFHLGFIAFLFHYIYHLASRLRRAFRFYLETFRDHFLCNYAIPLYRCFHQAREMCLHHDISHFTTRHHILPRFLLCKYPYRGTFLCSTRHHLKSHLGSVRLHFHDYYLDAIDLHTSFHQYILFDPPPRECPIRVRLYIENHLGKLRNPLNQHKVSTKNFHFRVVMFAEEEFRGY